VIQSRDPCLWVGGVTGVSPVEGVTEARRAGGRGRLPPSSLQNGGSMNGIP
jgi:hypothetical protein